MSVEVLAGTVVAHGGTWVGVACCDLHVSQIDTFVEHGGDKGVPQHVRVHPRQLHASQPVRRAAAAAGSRSMDPSGCRERSAEWLRWSAHRLTARWLG